MQRMLLALLLILPFALTAWAQEADTNTGAEAGNPEQASTEPESIEDDAGAGDDEEEEEVEDDSDLDDQSYADTEEDDFRPSEDIPADQSIPFPTDI